MNRKRVITAEDARDLQAWATRRIAERFAPLIVERQLRLQAGDADAWRGWPQAVDVVLAELRAEFRARADALSFIEFGK